MKVIDNLLDAKKNLEEKTNELNNANAVFYDLENKFNLLKGRVMGMDMVKNLPNQLQREAAIDTLLNNDERFSGLFRGYLEAKASQERAKNDLFLARDVVKIQVTIANCLTYGKDSE